MEQSPLLEADSHTRSQAIRLLR